MKTNALVLLSAGLLVGCSGPSPADTEAAGFLPGPLPAGWMLTESTDPKQFKPLRGLSNPVAQLKLTDHSTTLTRDLAPGKPETFHPTLILLVFPRSQLETVEEAAEKEAVRSDCSPMIFGQTDQYVFVTSPGYVNRGLHSPEAEATVERLKASLKDSMEIREPVVWTKSARPITVRATLEPNPNRRDWFVIRVTNTSEDTLRFLDVPEGSGNGGEFFEIAIQRDGHTYESQGNCLYAPRAETKVVTLPPHETYHRNIQLGAYVRSEKHIAPPFTATVTYRLSENVKAAWKARAREIDLDFTFQTSQMRVDASSQEVPAAQ
ncbi:MAG: hypothetical protein ACOY3P_26835 [Planctomycetota bacterium]